MNLVLCSSNIKCPRSLGFMYIENYVRRAGIIPVMNHENTEYVLLGFSKEIPPVWADLGGRSEKNEMPLDTALREFREESRNSIYIDINKNIERILLTGEHRNGIAEQMIIFVRVYPTYENINVDDVFQKITPKTQYEDEMIYLKWIPYDQFLNLRQTSSTLKDVQNLLKSLQ